MMIISDISERKRSISDYDPDVPDMSLLPKRRSLSLETVPDFECQAYFQDTVQTLKLSQLMADHRYLVLFFYECDFTEEATRDIEQIIDHFTQFEQQRTIPIVISTDTPMVHRGFCSATIPGALAGSPPFPMLGDTTRLIARHFDALDEQSGNAKRCVYLIDSNGRIKYSFTPLEKDQPYCMSLLLSMVKHLVHVESVSQPFYLFLFLFIGT
ncbi:thioredoxin-like protein [Hesseltinella vesiculosa]|uniref:Thioredoxin-like protein n=1 Tax=Hesseltinella vesiculosa TaxID=101127 RepID=A0A1X2GRA2_9FUNG|nr:thioredoxin-like protein [Hesseltinella vesiculosa]